MLILQRASKAYDQGQKILNQVDLLLKRGDFLFIVGDSGVGKTTLLKLLSGEERPSSGKAILEGGHHLSTDTRRIMHFRKRLGVVHQDFRLLMDRTVFDNVAAPLYYGRAGTGVSRLGFWTKGAHALVEKTLAQVDLSPRMMNERVDTLSGGERQRVAIARAIVNFPDVLIADEPTGSLDHDHTWAIIDLFQRLNIQGMTIILATHDREIIRKVRKPTGHLKEGKLRFDTRDGACIF